ncbi:peptidase inhibitor family I36 protein [Streptomyces phaeochromogenes]
MKKTGLVGVAAGTLMLSGMATAPASASASAWNDCPPGHFCLYEHANGGQLMYAYDECTPLGVVNIGSVGEGDKITSAWNRSSFVGAIYDWQGFWSFMTNFQPNSAQRNLPADFNDKTDGFRVVC